MSACKTCDGDGYCESLGINDEYAAWLCYDCNGTGQRSMLAALSPVPNEEER